MAANIPYRKPQINLEPIPKNNSLITPILISLILTFIILSIITSYIAYTTIPGKPQELNINLPQENIPTIPTQQFYNNMKFNHNNLTYTIDEKCPSEKITRVLESFQYVSEKVPTITFQPGSTTPDITVSCSLQEKESEQKDFFIAGEGGAKEIIQTKDYNVITHGVILLYKETEKSKKCEWPNIEIHELMHVFGFNHSTNKNSLMYQYLESCEQELDNSIIQKLNQLYSEENLADLYFQNVSAIKKGRYLDFNVTIKNSGTINAKNVILTVLDNQEIAETKNLGEIKYGGGVTLSISNLKLIHRNPDEITLIINKDNIIKEKNNQDNIITIKLN